MRVTKPQRPIRKSARIKAIQHFKERTNSKSQKLVQHSFSPNSTNNSRSSNLQTCENPSGPDQRPSRKRKRSQGTEELIPPINDQPNDPEGKTYIKENEENRQLPPPSASSSHEQSETDNCYPKKRKVLRQAPPTAQFQENSLETNNPIFERSEEEPKASKSQEKEKEDPISYWAANHIWPNNFAESGAMSSSDNTSKRQRILDPSQNHKDVKPQSYTQSRQNGDVPEQYTKSYENYICTQGLDMDDSKGEQLVSSDSKETCEDLQDLKCVAISPTVYSRAETLRVVKRCRNRNEATINRDVTPLIVPPIISLYLKNGLNLKDGVNQFEHFTDEVNTQWHESWVLVGPRPKPDLTVGFLSSAFTIEQNGKLSNYTSFENLTRPTDELCFPFLMCEVKCGNEGLDYADRQNMHSCSVAVKALLKLEQKADLYREDKRFEDLLGQILVYSISHDQKYARLYGHYALVKEEKWRYYRYYIGNYDIGHKEQDLLALHNFARNVLTVHAPKLLERLQEAIAALPVSSMLSRSADSMDLDVSQRGSEQHSVVRDADGFAIPVLPASTQKLLDEQREQMNKMLQDGKEREERMERQMKEVMEHQMKEAMERQMKEAMERQMKEAMERQMKEAMERQMKDAMERQMKEAMERQMKENNEREMKEARDQIKELTNMLKMQIGDK